MLGSEQLPISLGTGAGGTGNALMLNSKTSEGQHFFQRVLLPVPALCQYKLSFKVKAQTVAKSRGFIWINLLNADSVMLLEDGYGRFEGTQDWTSFSQTFFVPSATEAVKIGGSITGKGTLWFDDFKLEEVAYQPNESSLSKEADNYIKVVVDTMRANALYRNRLNFDDIYQIIRFNAKGANKPEDTYAAIQKSIPYLVDHHSSFFTPTELKQYFGDVNIRELINNDGYLQRDGLNIDSLKATLNFSSGRLINDKVGYLAIAPFTHLYLAAVTMYSDSIQQLIKQFDRNKTKGWIIDLRENNGGATPPMIVGIGPLLPENNKGYYVNDQHQSESEFFYQNGAFYENEVGKKATPPILISKINYKVKDGTLPVAVLIGPESASAAEGVATILAGNPHVKMFGKKTAGLTTGNDFFVLEDEAVLNLTTSFLANRDQVVYERGIEPDVVVEAEVNQDATEDAVLEAALQWIERQ